MDILGALASYVSAVQSGSLSGAARQRRMTQPAISQQITALENQFDSQLLLRDRNGVRMTQSGKVVFEHAVSMLDRQNLMISELEKLSGEIAGQITITANLAFSHHTVGEIINNLSTQHPNLKIDLRADDNLLDLAPEKIDVALRSGTVGNGNGVFRKIGAQSILHVATPKYLDGVGRPKTPDDLAKLDYIQYKTTDDQIATPLLKGQEAIQAPIKIGLTAQAPYLLFQALYSHLGFAKLPEYLVSDAMKQGKLEAVLPNWSIPEKELFLVYPSGENHTPPVTAFLHALIAKLGATKGVNLAESVKRLHLNS